MCRRKLCFWNADASPLAILLIIHRTEVYLLASAEKWALVDNEFKDIAI